VKRTALRHTRRCASAFQRNFPTKDGVTSSVNRTHPAFAELLDDLVVAEPSPDHGRTFSGRLAYIARPTAVHAEHDRSSVLSGAQALQFLKPVQNNIELGLLRILYHHEALAVEADVVISELGILVDEPSFEEKLRFTGLK